MRIQEEAPLPASPLVATLDEDYEMAVVHVAWDRQRGRNGKEDERTLLFAFVELIPAEIPPPVDDYRENDRRFFERLGGNSDHSVCVRHAVVPAKEALSWYLDCRRAVAVLPGDGRLPKPDAPDAKRLRLADLGEVPLWPTLVCAADNSDEIPFGPEWAECPRMHHLVPVAEFDLEALWLKPEEERARRWLADHLHFDLEEYPEYWGSVHLLAPNPMYRELHMRLQPRTPPAESVLMQFEPRAGKRVEGLELACRGLRASEKAYAYNLLVQSPLMRLNFPRGSYGRQDDIIDPVRGTLTSSNLVHGFLGRINFSVALSGKRDVKGPTPETSYSVMTSNPVEQIHVGEASKLASAESRLNQAVFRRGARAAAKRQNQRWFRGQQEDAVDVLRGLIHEATREVLLVDPYFGGTELQRFMLAVGREDIPVRILTSAQLRELKNAGPEGGPSSSPEEVLFNVLQQVRSHQRMNPFEIKVMKGNPPAVHDRFLLVDDRIWLLGSSLNNFGQRGTMMVSLPDPDPIREQLTKAWNDSVDFETWIKRCGKRLGDNGAQGT